MTENVFTDLDQMPPQIRDLVVAERRGHVVLEHLAAEVGVDADRLKKICQSGRLKYRTGHSTGDWLIPESEAHFVRNGAKIESEHLLARREILALAKSYLPIRVVPGVYFLVRGQEIVYIGQSESVSRRIANEHMKTRAFDAVAYHEIEGESYLRIEYERAYIRRLRPVENDTPVNWDIFRPDLYFVR